MKEFNITFEEFEAHLNHAVSILNLQEGLYDVVSKYNEANKSFEFDFGYFPTLLDDVVSLLEKLTDDTENHWISYWVFDLDCGRLCRNGCAEDEEGNMIPLATVSDLWKVLTNH